MLTQELYDLLGQYGDDIMLAIQKRLDADDNVATGKSRNSLLKRVTPNSLEIEGWKYLETISGGRQPGLKPPPIARIMGWIHAREIPYKKGRLRTVAFFIAKRISERGLKGNNMLTDIKNQFAPRLDADIADIIEDEILKIAGQVTARNKTVR